MKKLFGGLAVLLIALGALGAYKYFNAAEGVSASALESEYFSADDQFIDVGGARVRVRIEGESGAPAIILVHGFTHSLETWDGWAAALKTDYCVIRYDLMGHGLTGPDPQRRYSPSERAQVIGDIMDKLNIAHASIAGNSLGGLAAWRFASTYPARVDKLILISPGAYPLNGAADAPAKIPAAMQVFLMTAPEVGVRASAAYIYADDAKITDERIAVMRDMMRRKGNGEAFVESLEEFTLPDPSEALSRITAPTLIEWGEGDMVIPVEQGRALAVAIANARLVTYPGLGHAAQEEAPEITVADALAFLATDAVAQAGGE